MFGRIGVIALNTYRESVRARILLGLAVMAFFVSLYALVVGASEHQHDARVRRVHGSVAVAHAGGEGRGGGRRGQEDEAEGERSRHGATIPRPRHAGDPIA